MLEGKVAVVTGAGRGIDRDIAPLMASRGANVMEKSFYPLDVSTDVYNRDPV